MKSIDEQMQIVLKRADKFRMMAKLRKWILGEVIVAILLVIAGVRSAIAVPIAVSQNSTGSVSGVYGSTVAYNERTGLVIVAVCAFLLGICLTLFFVHVLMYRWEKKQ